MRRSWEREEKNPGEQLANHVRPGVDHQSTELCSIISSLLHRNTLIHVKSCATDGNGALGAFTLQVSSWPVLVRWRAISY